MKITRLVLIFYLINIGIGIAQVQADANIPTSQDNANIIPTATISKSSEESTQAQSIRNNMQQVTTENSNIDNSITLTETTNDKSVPKEHLNLNPKRPCLDTKGLCKPNLLTKEQQKALPINITADIAKGHKNDNLVYSGDVELIQGYEKIIANTMTYSQIKNSVTAEGNAYFYDGEIEGISDNINQDLKTKDVTMNQTKYQFLCSMGRGHAKVIFKNGLGYYQMKDGSYTTCPVGNNSWHLESKTIERAPDSNYATLYNSTFRVMDVPIFYLPYLRFPVTKERLTGFLFPTMGISTRDGTTLRVPFYWNIAPQYDLLITPYYMSNRGVQLQSQFRYLSSIADGDIRAEYLNNDKLYPDSNSRWGFNWRNYKRNGHWRYNIDYSRVSDINYFAQLNSDLGSIEDSSLLQTGQVSYYDDNWQITLMARNFQALMTYNELYRVVPSLTANYDKLNLLPWLNFSWKNQIARFENDSPIKPSATRFHSEPTFSIPYSNSWLSLIAESKLYYTYYEQEFNNDINNIKGDASLKHQVDRLIPSLRLGATVTFDREGNFFGNKYLQVLQPRIQYLYVPKVDQSGIYNPADFSYGGYDSSYLQTDYYGLFRDNSYSSVDYIANANQLTIGATTRFYDDQMKERFNLSLGQIVYFGQNNKVKHSTIAADSEFNYHDFIFVHSSAEYNPHESVLQYANTTVELRNKARYLQLSYRYVADEYIVRNIQNPSVVTYTDNGISQVGMVAGLPINNRLSLRAQYFYDLRQKEMSEGDVGVNFQWDCWSIGINVGRNMYSRSDIHTAPTYENNINLSISLLGLGSNVALSYDLKPGLSNILGYGDPFNLRY